MAAHEPCTFGGLSPRADNRTREREEFDWSRMRREENDYHSPKDSIPIQRILKRVMTRVDKGIRPDQEVKRLRRLPYSEYLQSDHWQSFRRLILARDHGCRICGSRKQRDVHHLDYDRKGQEEKEDVIVLCRKCHEKWHHKGPLNYMGSGRPIS